VHWNWRRNRWALAPASIRSAHTLTTDDASESLLYRKGTGCLLLPERAGGGAGPGASLRVRAPMALTRETEKAALEAFLLEQKAVHIYAIGDLHPSCWADCVWDGLREPVGGALRAVALTYRGLAVPVLQVLADPRSVPALDAAKRVLELLVAAPERLPAGAFEAHLNSSLETVLRDAGFAVEAHPHLRMVLAPADLAHLRAGPPLRGQGRAAAARRLTPADADACMDLCGTLERSWFEPQCLGSGIYYGVYSDGDDGGSLLAMGGTHVAAPEYGVAALGNIATRASQRRKGYGRLVVRALCLALADHGIETIGLNVTADNEAAIGMYKALNFHTAMEFVECDVENRAAAQAGI
jgi:ribosomal protein S18 acetylase RimI-like enzyme